MSLRSLLDEAKEVVRSPYPDEERIIVTAAFEEPHNPVERLLLLRPVGESIKMAVGVTEGPDRVVGTLYLWPSSDAAKTYPILWTELSSPAKSPPETATHDQEAAKSPPETAPHDQEAAQSPESPPESQPFF